MQAGGGVVPLLGFYCASIVYKEAIDDLASIVYKEAIDDLASIVYI